MKHLPIQDPNPHTRPQCPIDRFTSGHYSNTRKAPVRALFGGGEPRLPARTSGLPPKEHETKEEREDTERFFWWRTACNTWQYLVSGPRSPAGSTVFYSIRGAAIRLLRRGCQWRVPWGTPGHPVGHSPADPPACTTAQICWHAYKSRFPADNCRPHGGPPVAIELRHLSLPPAGHVRV